MSDLEGANTKRGRINRYATRYGGIVERVRDVNGIRKVVLVVNARLPTSKAQDAYADWFRRWCQHQEETSNSSERTSDETTPLVGTASSEAPRYLDDAVHTPQEPLENRGDG
ncbi:hypothetical protein BDV59DRAFT_49789 [Aspergillus ambiguus]|uniref:uncharacterized protein n=1 Tax=Aspergillus ambiguus TaxID=176160 RepID=UPI003CCC93CD